MSSCIFYLLFVYATCSHNVEFEIRGFERMIAVPSAMRATQCVYIDLMGLLAVGHSRSIHFLPPVTMCWMKEWGTRP